MVTVVPEIIVETIKPDHDFLIIACDGIWDCLSSQQATDFVYEQRKKMKARQSVAVTSSTASTISGSSPTAGTAGKQTAAAPLQKKNTGTPVKRPSMTTAGAKGGASPSTKSPSKKL